MSLGRKLVRGRYWRRAVKSAGVTPVADPTEIANLNRWYDPSDAGSLTIVTDACSQMNDKSGNGYHITQGTASLRPATTSTINSLGVLHFDGAGDYMNLDNSGVVGIFDGADAPFTIFMVVQPDVANATGWAFCFNDISTGQPYHGLGQVLDGGTGYWRTNRRDTAGSTVALNSTTTSTTSAVLLTLTFTGTTVTLRVDGTTTSINATAMDVGDMDVERFTLGAYRQGGSTFDSWDGKIGEVALYSAALSTGDRASVEAYFADKWAITL